MRRYGMGDAWARASKPCPRGTHTLLSRRQPSAMPASTGSRLWAVAFCSKAAHVTGAAWEIKASVSAWVFLRAGQSPAWWSLRTGLNESRKQAQEEKSFPDRRVTNEADHAFSYWSHWASFIMRSTSSRPNSFCWHHVPLITPLSHHVHL